MMALSYEDFFARYVAHHSRPATRWTHFAGAHLGALTAAAALIRGRPALALGLPLLGYGSAWFSHLAIENNRPVSFDRPLWSLRAGLQMIAMMWQGRDDELTRIARDQGMIVIQSGSRSAA